MHADRRHRRIKTGQGRCRAVESFDLDGWHWHTVASTRRLGCQTVSMDSVPILSKERSRKYNFCCLERITKGVYLSVVANRSRRTTGRKVLPWEIRCFGRSIREKWSVIFHVERVTIQLDWSRHLFLQCWIAFSPPRSLKKTRTYKNETQFFTKLTRGNQAAMNW